ncbi:UNVERIFIED_CONTAM: hypothetical protein FKN15_073696 [Acipenser sinensis]
MQVDPSATYTVKRQRSCIIIQMHFNSDRLRVKKKITVAHIRGTKLFIAPQKTPRDSITFQCTT